MTSVSGKRFFVWLSHCDGAMEERGALIAIRIAETPVRIGRGPDADIDLEDCTVSRRHAELRIESDGVLVLRDLGSENGSTLNGYAVPRRGGFVLEPGATLQFGHAFPLRVTHVWETFDSAFDEASVDELDALLARRASESSALGDDDLVRAAS